MIRVGPAGWSYADWEGRVYPARKPRAFHALPYLARFVECMEINSSFYAPPSARNATRWAELVEPWPDFRFSAKLLRTFTHEPRPRNIDPWAATAREWLAGIEPLIRARRLACVLVQFPVSFLHGPEEVARLGRLRHLFAGVPLVLEVRHESWFSPPALDTLRGLDYSAAHVDMPAAWNHPPAWHRATGPIGYLRLHGRNTQHWFRRGAGRDDRYDYLYAPPEISELAERAARIAHDSEDTYVVTNNHFAGKAVANAIELMYVLHGREPQPAPPELVESFPHLGPITHITGQHELFG